ncbi:hypothetical protein VTI74DRAFT_3458 [Chaetomium olivicolor]
MLVKQYVAAVLIASASVVLALPRPAVVDLSVREADDFGTGYKRATVETFVCKRGENQSLSCLRKKEASDAVDQSATASP